MQFAQRLNNVETSAIRELFKLLGKPGIISFAGGFPDSAMFDVEGIQKASGFAPTQTAVHMQRLIEALTQRLGVQGHGLVAVADQGGHGDGLCMTVAWHPAGLGLGYGHGGAGQAGVKRVWDAVI